MTIVIVITINLLIIEWHSHMLMHKWLEDNIYILEDENKTQNEVIENIMINILDLMCPNDINNLK